jgi:hypothetical protein
MDQTNNSRIPLQLAHSNPELGWDLETRSEGEEKTFASWGKERAPVTLIISYQLPVVSRMR